MLLDGLVDDGTEEDAGCSPSKVLLACSRGYLRYVQQDVAPHRLL